MNYTRTCIWVCIFSLSISGCSATHDSTDNTDSEPFELTDPEPQPEEKPHLMDGDQADWTDAAQIQFHYKNEMLSIEEYESLLSVEEPSFTYTFIRESKLSYPDFLEDYIPLLRGSAPVFMGMKFPTDEQNILHMVECYGRSSTENVWTYHYSIDNYLIGCNVFSHPTTLLVKYIGKNPEKLAQLQDHYDKIYRRRIELNTPDSCLFCEDGLLTWDLYFYFAATQDGLAATRWLIGSKESFEQKHYIDFN